MTMERIHDLADGTHVKVTAPLNFSVSSADGQTIAATTTSAATQIDATGASEDVMVWNKSAVVIHIKCGASNVVATANSMPILPGEKGSYYKGNSTHIAVIAASSTGDIWVKAGEGA